MQCRANLPRAAQRVQGTPFLASPRACAYSAWYQSRGVGLFMTHVQPRVRQNFENGGVVKLLGEDHFHDSVAAAIAHIEMIEMSR